MKNERKTGADHLTAREAAGILGVSPATLANWRRAGHLDAATARPLRYAGRTVERLAERIRTDRFRRLRARANKTASAEIRLPVFSGAVFAGPAADLIRAAGKAGVSPDTALFLAAIRLLALAGEASAPPGAGPAWQRPSPRACTGPLE